MMKSEKIKEKKTFNKTHEAMEIDSEQLNTKKEKKHKKKKKKEIEATNVSQPSEIETKNTNNYSYEEMDCDSPESVDSGCVPDKSDSTVVDWDEIKSTLKSEFQLVTSLLTYLPVRATLKPNYLEKKEGEESDYDDDEHIAESTKEHQVLTRDKCDELIKSYNEKIKQVKSKLL